MSKSAIWSPKSQTNSHSPMGWTGLSMGFSRVPPRGIPPNPSVLSRPMVPWDGQACPWDSHVSYPYVFPPNPSILCRPIIPWDGQAYPWDSYPYVYPQVPVSCPIHPVVPWDGQDCQWYSHVSQFLEMDVAIGMKTLSFYCDNVLSYV